jgi:hypothetical protein
MSSNFQNARESNVQPARAYTNRRKPDDDALWNVERGRVDFDRSFQVNLHKRKRVAL